jgi:hypothetical protein
VKLEQKPALADAEETSKLDHAVIRPFTPRFDPSMEREWVTAVETYVLENVDGTTHDRLQAAMICASMLVLMPPRTIRT